MFATLSLSLFRAILISQCLLVSSVLIAETRDSRAIEMKNLGIAIAPPVGWEINTDHELHNAVIYKRNRDLRDPLKIEYSNRIAIDVSPETVEISEERAALFQVELAEMFQGREGVKSFALSDELKFFDYRGENDGLILYSFLELEDSTPVTQMHIIVAGENNRVILSFAHFSEQFDEALAPAWASMNSISIIGPAPVPFATVLLAAKAGAGALGALFFMLLLRRWRSSRLLKLADFDEDDTYSSTPKVKSKAPAAKKAAVKRVKQAAYEDEEDFSEDDILSEAPRKIARRPEPVAQKAVAPSPKKSSTQLVPPPPPLRKKTAKVDEDLEFFEAEEEDDWGWGLNASEHG